MPNNYALNSNPKQFEIGHPETILEGGELVPNLSLYRLRTAADHPTDIWRLAEPEAANKGSSSSAQEKACERHLQQLMLKQPDTPVPKNDCWEDVQTLFPGIRRRSFLRAWDRALAGSGAVLWGMPGRRKGSRNRTPK